MNLQAGKPNCRLLPPVSAHTHPVTVTTCSGTSARRNALGRHILSRYESDTYSHATLSSTSAFLPISFIMFMAGKQVCGAEFGSVCSGPQQPAGPVSPRKRQCRARPNKCDAAGGATSTTEVRRILLPVQRLGICRYLCDAMPSLSCTHHVDSIGSAGNRAQLWTCLSIECRTNGPCLVITMLADACCTHPAAAGQCGGRPDVGARELGRSGGNHPNVHNKKQERRAVSSTPTHN